MKLLKYDNFKVKYWFYMTYLIIWKETSLQLQKNPEYKETDSINSVQSSVKFHSLWITLSDFVFKFIQ